MNRVWIIVVSVTVLLTLAVTATWAATGLHAYTKYEVVEQVELPLDPDDPLVQAGFYEGTTRTETVRRKEFHLGLLPVPQGLVDKHALSVMSLTVPIWTAVLALWWWRRRRRGASDAPPAAISFVRVPDHPSDW